MYYNLNKCEVVIYLNEDEAGTDATVVCYPHLVLCMGVTLLMDDGVLIGAGAKVLGNISVGHCSRIAAGSVVLHDVPPKSTVAGVPAKVVGEAGCSNPSIEMDQILRG